MANSGGKITSPVSFADVNSVLGTRHTSLGLLCTDNNINKWAKYKPVVKNIIDITGQLDANKNWLSSATWWKGTNSNCGITYTSYTTVAAARTAIINKTAIWSYTKPSGGSSSPYRLTDFNQYDHNALPPCTGTSAPDAYLRAGAEWKVIAIPTMDTGLNLRLNHIGNFANYYYLVAVFDGSGNLKFLQTSSKKVGQYTDGESIEISVPFNNGSYGYQGKLSENGTYYAFMMLSSVSYNCATSAQSGTYVPLPTKEGDYGAQPDSFTAKSDSMYASVNAYTTGTNSRIVNWDVKLYGAGNPSSVTMRLIYASNGSTVSGQEKTISFSNGSSAISGGYERSNKPSESFTCPDTNIDNYRLQFIYSRINVKAVIGHDINPNS